MTSDNTAVFITLLKDLAERSMVTVKELRRLQEATTPCKPCLSRDASMERRFSFGEAFKDALAGRVDWTLIRREAAQLERQVLEGQKETSEMSSATRLFLLSGDRARAPYYTERLVQLWVQQWETAWSSRNVEQVMCFFTENASYSTEGITTQIHGKANLRRLFSNLFHKMSASVRVEEVLANAEGEFVLKWIRRSLPSSKQSTDSGRELLVRGQSTLKVEYAPYFLKVQNSVSKCVDSWNNKDVIRLVFSSPAVTTVRDTSIVSTATELIFPSGLHIPRNPSQGATPGHRAKSD